MSTGLQEGNCFCGRSSGAACIENTQTSHMSALVGNRPAIGEEDLVEGRAYSHATPPLHFLSSKMLGSPIYAAWFHNLVAVPGAFGPVVRSLARHILLVALLDNWGLRVRWD